MNIFQFKSIQKQLSLSEKQELYVRNNIPILSQSPGICILCAYENDTQILEMLETIDQYQGRIKRIRLLVYVPLKKNPSILQKSLFIEPVLKNDINFFGKLKGNTKQNIQSNHYDILINTITGTHRLISDFIALFIHADFKISRSEESAAIYHLTIPLETESSLSYYLETIEKYTNKLNGK